MDIPRNWRLQGQRYRLEGRICDFCGAKVFPVQEVCPVCGKPLSVPYTFSGYGSLYSFTRVQEIPAGYEENAPYVLAMVKLDEGPLVTAQLTDLGDTQLQIGMPVEMVTRRLRSATDERGLLVYGYKFRPAVRT